MVVDMVEAPADFQMFRVEREAELIEPYGWLTLCGFHWLPTEPASLPSLPGRWWADGSQAHASVDVAAADGLTID